MSVGSVEQVLRPTSPEVTIVPLVMGTKLEDFTIAADTRVRREIILMLEAFIALRVNLSGANGEASQKDARLVRRYLGGQFMITVMFMVLFPMVT